MILPYPVVYVEDGIMLLYFTSDTIVDKRYKFVFDKNLNDTLCLFGNLAVPVGLLKNLDLSKQKTIYFMRYDLNSVVADFIGSFTMDEQFIIEMKVQIKLQELQQSSIESNSNKTVTHEAV